MLGDGTIMAKGNNQYGQLGLGDNIDRDEFVAVEIEDVKWVMSSGDHSFLIKNDGSIWSCGRNDVGQLGLGDTENRNVFSDVGVVINDNDMSVSKNVGAVARTFNKIRIKRDKSFVYKLTPKCIHGFIDKIKNSLKGAIYRKNLFDSFGIKYFQGIDGHNFKELDKYLTFAKNYSKSVILHVKTKKGKGYKFAEEDNIGLWHNVGPFNLETGEFTENHAVDPVGKYLSEVLIEEVEKDSHIKVINAAMSLGNSLTLFQNAYPNHCH